MPQFSAPASQTLSLETYKQPETPHALMKFEDFDFDDDLLDSIEAMNYNTATPIQEQAIPLVLQGKDLIACAQTGTGKTAAFVLPILQNILLLNPGKINTLILVPTRELALQIDQQIEAMSYYIEVSSIAIYGGGTGNTWNQQKTALTEGTDIIIATPRPPDGPDANARHRTSAA